MKALVVFYSMYGHIYKMAEAIAEGVREGADDEEVKRLFKLAIDSKPEGNYLKEPGKSDAIDSMSSIGG